MQREEFILSVLLQPVAKYCNDLSKYTSVQDENLKYILQKAEHWALGGKQPENNIPSSGLKPVLENLNRQGNLAHVYTFEPTKLELSKNFFPKKKTYPTNAPKSLFDELSKELNTLPDNTAVFIENCYNLLHKYTVTIPFHTQLPDVPLFDHCKTMTAFAVCLYDYLHEKQKFTLEPTDAPVLFLGGSASGIQAYIYGIISKFATKNLKGRSFYLQLLVDSVIEKILYELHLFHCNIVYASGGGFYMLVPNTEAVKNKIKELEKQIADNFFEQFKTALSFNISSTELSEADITQNKIAQKWGELTEKLNQQKRTKYADKIQTDYSYFFENAEHGGTLKKDTITNEEITTEHFAKNHVFEVKEDGISEEPSTHPEPDKNYILKLTKQQIELGKYLRETNFILKSTHKVNYWKQEALHYENPLNLGIHWYFFDKLPKQLTAERCTVIQLNNPENFLKTDWSNKQNLIYDFTFYGGNDTPESPTNKHEPKNFNDLGGNENDTFRRIAILRMDVDNLGNAFIKGLASKQTFSRYSTLSRSLDFFFKGYINTLWKQNPEFKEWIYIVYAGGDDLFIAGKWDTVIDFAETIKKEFSEWACYNPELTLSAGIAIIPPKYPVLKGAELSGEAEETAKKHSNTKQQKNAVCMLDIPLNWESEFTVVKNLKDEMVSQLALPRGFLHKIQTLHAMSAEQKKHKQNESWQWIMAYDFARMKERKKNDDNFEKYLTDLQNKILTNNVPNTHYTYLELFNVAARWAELETKNEKN